MEFETRNVFSWVEKRFNVAIEVGLGFVFHRLQN